MIIHSPSLIQLSASKIKTFQSCPRKYYYEYLHKLPKEKHPAAALGSAVHKTIERVYKEHAEPVSTFLKEFAHELVKYNITEFSWGQEAKLRNDGIKMVGDYDYSRRIPTQIEVEFRLPFPNAAHAICSIHGYIDQVYATSFVDLKTNARKPTQDVLDNDIQFILYAWAFKEIYQVYPEQAIWHHLRTQQDLIADVQGKEDYVSFAVDAILEAEITGYPKIPYKAGKTCLFCPFKDRCAVED
jgi:hypothetical protein